MQPLADQYVATPFIAALPGYAEETYTATVSVYVALAAWSSVVLLGAILRANSGQMLLVALILMLSNLLVYIATSHSIPLLEIGRAHV